MEEYLDPILGGGAANVFRKPILSDQALPCFTGQGQIKTMLWFTGVFVNLEKK